MVIHHFYTVNTDHRRLIRLSSPDNAYKNDDDGDDEQNMDESVKRIGGDHTSQPEKNQDGCDHV